MMIRRRPAGPEPVTRSRVEPERCPTGATTDPTTEQLTPLFVAQASTFKYSSSNIDATCLKLNLERSVEAESARSLPLSIEAPSYSGNTSSNASSGNSPILSRARPMSLLPGCASNNSMPRPKRSQGRSPSNPRCGARVPEGQSQIVGAGKGCGVRRSAQWARALRL